jgi:hypothetical protein
LSQINERDVKSHSKRSNSSNANKQKKTKDIAKWIVHLMHNNGKGPI